MTYTAARVKQEIAKEGILPGCTILANNVKIFNNDNNLVPLGALVLHGSMSALLVLATAKLAPLQAYRILVGLYSYTIDAIFGIMLSIGIFVLRIRSRSFAIRSFLPYWVSMGAATIYGLSMAFPVCASFVKPSAVYVKYYASSIPWYTVGTVSWCCVALGAIWLLGFRYLYPLKHSGKQLLVLREFVMTRDLTLDHETIKFSWKPGAVGGPRMIEETRVTGDEPAEMMMPLGFTRV